MMIITNHKFKDDEKIPESELIQMGLRIKRFVNNYRKLVTINVPNKDDINPFDILDTLEDIANKLVSRKFDQLFDDINIIDFGDITVPF